MRRPPDSGPPLQSLLADRIDGRGSGYGAYRPHGTRDWLLLYTIAGLGRFDHADGRIDLLPGDLILVKPGTPQDYGTEPTLLRWKNIWAHFLPRSDTFTQLNWPQPARGVLRVRVASSHRAAVVTELSLMDRRARASSANRIGLALNALERACLLADEANPNRDGAGLDPRIRRAEAYIFDHLEQAMTIAGLAEEAGMSRSAFALLFKSELSTTPSAFIETQRLDRARRLLESTDRALKDLAAQLGFSSPFYLSLRFKHRFGESPRAYRNRRRDASKRPKRA